LHLNTAEANVASGLSSSDNFVYPPLSAFTALAAGNGGSPIKDCAKV